MGWSVRDQVCTWWTGLYDTLDGIIRRDRRWLPALLDYVNYIPNPAIQAEAVKIALVLNARLPQLPQLLLQPAVASNILNLLLLPAPWPMCCLNGCSWFSSLTYI
jgi:hypothetical protein